MRRSFLTEVSVCFRPSVAIVLMLTAIPFRLSDAENLLGLYVGGAVGRAQVDASIPEFNNFGANHSAYKVIVGIRPISLIGAEIAYNDFGHPSEQFGLSSANVTMKGESAFGVLYLPIPIVDIFLKAGIARIESTATTNIVLCVPPAECPQFMPVSENRTNEGFAGGVGAQFKFGSLAVRGEYERFNAAGGNPSLLSVGILWKF
jgi:opacity protein-like surface antigen